jgi:hypothetical protein
MYNGVCFQCMYGDYYGIAYRHSTRQSSVVLREYPEAVREFPSELGIARTTDLTVSRVRII